MLFNITAVTVARSGGEEVVGRRAATVSQQRGRWREGQERSEEEGGGGD